MTAASNRSNPPPARHRLRPAMVLAAALWVWPGAEAVHGQVIRDGTLRADGQALRLRGPNYTIGPEHGRQEGVNLFHSFRTFNLASGERATFSGPGSVQNVLARVTGGAASSINGTLACDIDGANLYFINPAGVIFGPNAQLDVRGAFAATTADVVKLADGGRFDARNVADSLLTSAPPAAFGFLAPRPAPIELAGRLELRDGRVVSIVGGNVTSGSSSFTRIEAPQGRINILATASSGDVVFNPADPDSPVGLTTVTRRGAIDIRDATLDVGIGLDGGNRAGSVFIAGDNVRFTDTGIQGETGAQDGGTIRLDSTGTVALVNSTIRTSIDFAPQARAGDIRITARHLVLSLNFPSEVISAAASFTGRGGDITIASDSLETDTNARLSVQGAAFDGSEDGQLAFTVNSVTVNAAPGALVLKERGQARFAVSRTLRTDSTLAPARDLIGPAYLIPPEAGATVGANLFHSFTAFELSSDETATFQGPDSIRHVLARVTGGTPSLIAGTLQCTIPGANLYFINPAGIDFIPSPDFEGGARLDVTAAFAATTADIVKLGGGGRFDASRPGKDVLTALSPVGFTFLGDRTAPINVLTNLQVQPGQVLSLVGGPVRLGEGGPTGSSSGLLAVGGRLNIIAARRGEVRLRADDLQSDQDLGALSQRSIISLLESSRLDVSNNNFLDRTESGGRIFLAGLDVRLRNATLDAGTGAEDGRGIRIDAVNDIRLLNSTIGTQSDLELPQDPGPRSGDIALRAPGVLTLEVREAGVVTINTNNGNLPRSGDVQISAGDVQVIGSASVGIAAAPTAQGGTVRLDAGSIVVDSEPGRFMVGPDGVGRFAATVAERVGGVRLDGTAGPPLTLRGPAYEVAAEMGILVDGNLFHSFARLELAPREELTFLPPTGDAPVRNVLARVTGGRASRIEGTIRSAIDGANLFLMNPAGLVLEPGGRIAAPASLVLTTAREMRFADGGRFGTVELEQDQLSGLTPHLFRFSDTPADITLGGATVSVQGNGVLNVLGGGVRLSDAVLDGGAGAGVRVVSMNSPGPLRLSTSNLADPIDLPDGAPLNDVKLLRSSIRGSANAMLQIRANALFLDGSTIGGEFSSDAFAEARADLVRGMTLNATSLSAGAVTIPDHSLALDDSLINGSTSIVARSVTLKDSGVRPSSDGGGTLSLTARELHVTGLPPRDPFAIENSALSQVAHLRVAGPARLSETSISLSPGTAAEVDSLEMMNASFFGSDATLTARSIDLSDSRAVLAETDALDVHLRDRSTLEPGLRLTAQRVRIESISRLAGGTMAIDVDDLSVANAAIEATDLTVRAEQLSLEDGRLLARANDSTAGRVHVEAGRIVLRPEGPLASILAIGGGAVSVTAGEVDSSQPLASQFVAAPAAAGPFGSLDVMIGGQPFVPRGAVHLDASLGEPRTLDGPDYVVLPEFGQRRGRNLFFSFASFDVAPGEGVAFAGTAPDQTEHVLARITGGSLSIINGPVLTDGAALYLINPSGVVLGPGASMQVPGSLAVTTASAVTLSGGGRFDVAGAASALSGGAPDGFLFADAPMATAPPEVIFDHTALRFEREGVLSLLGHDVRLRGPVIQTERLRLNIVAAGPAQAALALDPVSRASSLEGASSGSVSIDEALIGRVGFTDFELGGPVIVRGGDVRLSRSSISLSAEPVGDLTRTIDIAADDALRVEDSGLFAQRGLSEPIGDLQLSGRTIEFIRSSAGLGPSNRGDVRLQARESLSLTDSGVGNANSSTSAKRTIQLIGRDVTMLRSDASTGFISASGGAGGILVEAKNEFRLIGGQLNTGTGRAPRSGDIEVLARSVLLDGADTPVETFAAEVRGSGIFSIAESSSFEAGDVRIAAQRLEMVRNAQIGAFGIGSNTGGNITVDVSDSIVLDGSTISARAVQAGSISLDGKSILLRNRSLITAQGDDAGSVRIGDADRPVDELRVTGGSTLSVLKGNVFSGGGRSGGDLRVTARNITIDGGSAVTAATTDAGPGGDIVIRAVAEPGGRFELLDNARVSASTSAAGRAGSIDIEAIELRLDGAAMVESSSTSVGPAGAVTLVGRRSLHTANGATVSSSAELFNAGSIELRSAHLVELRDSTVSVRSGGDSGNIKFTAPFAVQIFDSEITAQAAGDGGQISIDPRIVVLKDSVINGLSAGEPVEVEIDQTAILLRSNTRILSDAVAAPDPSDVSGSLLSLDPSLTAAAARLQEACGIRIGDISSFLVIPRGGVPVESAGTVPSFLTAPQREQRPSDSGGSDAAPGH